jgi:hypothetical protein
MAKRLVFKVLSDPSLDVVINDEKELPEMRSRPRLLWPTRT